VILLFPAVLALFGQHGITACDGVQIPAFCKQQQSYVLFLSIKTRLKRKNIGPVIEPVFGFEHIRIRNLRHQKANLAGFVALTGRRGPDIIESEDRWQDLQ